MARWKQGKITRKSLKHFSEFKFEMPENVIDRAHRIGKVVKMNGKNARQITTWHHRTMVYEARKNFGKYMLDLAKHLNDLLENANEQLKCNKQSVAFCNINCQPYWFNKGKYH